MSTLPSPEDSSRGHAPKKRPESVEKLGLSLPVTEKDVKQAYYKRAQTTHPDHGGAMSDFLEVQDAFDEAVEFAKRNGKRLPWIGAQMPIYVAQRDAIELVEELGGDYEVESLDWLEGTVGDDFALIADRLKSIDLAGKPLTDRDLVRMLEDAPHLAYLERLDLSDTPVGDVGVAAATHLPTLHQLDLRGTQVSFAQRRKLAALPNVLRVEGTSRVGEWFRRFTHAR